MIVQSKILLPIVVNLACRRFAGVCRVRDLASAAVPFRNNNWALSPKGGSRFTEVYGRQKYRSLKTMATLKLPISGVPVPAIGYGVGTAWYNSAGNDPSRPANRELVDAIKGALDIGYRHLDNAEMYGNDIECGIALKESSVPREEIWVTTKVWTGIADPLQTLKDSLKRMQLDYVELYLIHAPFFSKKTHGIDLPDAWKAMEKAHELGLAKHIGVSNFRVADLEALDKVAKVKPEVNQVEFNPYLQQPELGEYCEKHGICREAYGPLVPIVKEPGGPLDAGLEEIAKKHGKTPGQVLLRWTIQEGVIAITTSSKQSRMKEQLSIFDFELSTVDMAAIREAGKKKHVRKFWTRELN